MMTPEDLDPQCAALIVAMNGLPGVVTYGSCCGHGDSSFSVWFRAATTDAMFRVMRAVDRRYASGRHSEWNWRVEVSLGDMPPFINYRLTSGETKGPLAYEQADAIARDMRESEWGVELHIVRIEEMVETIRAKRNAVMMGKRAIPALKAADKRGGA